MKLRKITAAFCLLAVSLSAFVYVGCKKEEEKSYTRVNVEGQRDSKGTYLQFGSYPQTQVADTALITALNTAAGALPAHGNNQAWTSYGYYVGTGSVGTQSNTTDYMWYQDQVYNGVKYRGVYFTAFRPYWSYQKSAKTYQDDNGYEVGKVYWFAYEPVLWKILSERNGEVLALCEQILDSQAYQNLCVKGSAAEGEFYYVGDGSGNVLLDANGNKVYANNYEASSVRAWLNNVFYNTAFDEPQKAIIQPTTVYNSTTTTNDSANVYVCDNTTDNVFLMSYRDMLSSRYAFATTPGKEDEARQRENTDYAKCQGSWTETTNYVGKGIWWLRSPTAVGSQYVSCAYADGRVDIHYNASYTGRGIVPALYLQLK